MSLFFKMNFVKIIFWLSLILFGGSTIASAESYETIISNGAAQNRVDIAVLGDGYTAAQAEKYRADVQQLIQAVFQQEPYREYQRYYNVHRINVISNQAGADHSERNPQFFVDTALDAAYNCQNIPRLICVNRTKVNEIIARTLPTNAYYDVVLILVNDSEYGGSGGAVAVASTHSSAVELILHEVGHSFARLADEYTSEGYSCNPNIEPLEANATRETSRGLIKWNHWINAATPIPTTTTLPNLPGLFIGSKYCPTGLYRPTYNSKMNTLGARFEQINTEEHVKRVYNLVSPIDSSSPAEPSITLTTSQSQTFSIVTPQPLTHSLNISWLIDGQPAANGASFSLDGSTLTPGTHTLQVIASDPTSFVRKDPAGVLTAARTWNLNVEGTAPRRVLFDYDGDGRADVSVFRPSNGVWYLLNSQTGFSAAQFGSSDDKLVPADYDGDGKTDIAVFRSGNWFLQRSNTGFASIQFGSLDDVPTPGDFDGDGRAELAVFRPSNGTWYVLNLANNNFNAVQFGTSTDYPVAADFDGDGKNDYAVYRPANGTWYLLQSAKDFSAVQFGISTDKPVVGDYDGDGRADQAVYRTENGTWYLLQSTKGFNAVQFGISTDVPTPADYDGDGKTDISVFRAENGVWYRLNSTNGNFSTIQFGTNSDKPVPAVFFQ